MPFDVAEEVLNEKTTLWLALAIVMVNVVVVTLCAFESVALTAISADPAAEGVPVMLPSAVLRVRPTVASCEAPDAIAKVRGLEPPPAEMINENAVPTVPVRPVVGVKIESAPAILRVDVAALVAVVPFLVLVTVTV